MAGPPEAAKLQPLLCVEDLRTYIDTEAGTARAVDGISFSLLPGKTLAIVGESGCGKTVTALSILRLMPEPPARIASGSIRFNGRDILKLNADELRHLRGGDIAMIFQDPAMSLNPVFTIGDQISEAISLHRKDISRKAYHSEIIKALLAVQINEPEKRLQQYPHELSGGMKQRAMIAMALACRPKLLIADEPTTAVDVTIQARILDLLRQVQAEHQMALLLITHDLGVVAELADEVVVMYAGKIIEQAPVQELFDRPRHPYTLGLFASLARIDETKGRLETIEGSVPPATHFPPGCRFRERCRWAQADCKTEPPLVQIGNKHGVACWHQESISGQRTSRARWSGARLWPASPCCSS